MHILFDTNSVKLENFFQKGAGISYFEGLPPYQRGRGYYVGLPHQRGRGIGNIFGGLWRLLLPALKSAGKHIGKEGLSTGGRILSNLAEGRKLNEVIKNETQAGVQNLLNKVNTQEGKGIKRPRKRPKSHSNKSTVSLIPSNIVGKTVKIPKLKKKRSDTFGLY